MTLIVNIVSNLSRKRNLTIFYQSKDLQELMILLSKCSILLVSDVFGDKLKVSLGCSKDLKKSSSPVSNSLFEV